MDYNNTKEAYEKYNWETANFEIEALRNIGLNEEKNKILDESEKILNNSYTSYLK